MKNFLLSVVLLSTLSISILCDHSCNFLANNGLCQKSMYRKIMCEICPNQCNALKGYNTCLFPIPSPDCEDKASNCEEMRALCTNLAYRNLMAVSCSSTCNTCDGNPATLPPEALLPPEQP
uniref:ShKT domain-containing protein n=1 Tax=Strongyloides venezuelensis TaxID=75913 RepID=A0A0K0FEQ8_STRVS